MIELPYAKYMTLMKDVQRMALFECHSLHVIIYT